MKFTYTDSDQDVLSRFFLSYSGDAPSDADLDTFAASVATAAGTHLEGLYPSLTELVEVSCEDLTSSTAAVGAATATAGGSRDGDALGAAVATVIQYKISRRYRGGHPRGYWPFGVTSDLATQSTWGSDFLAAVLSGYNDFVTEWQAAGWSGAGALLQVNVSYYEGFTPHEYPSGRYRNIPNLRVTPLQDTVELVTVNPHLGSQRRRNQQRLV